ncbi:MAG: hypothetical protein JRH11_10940 [Deltaproteobacteria bacterium]|nr:hypothetical protein [Deltaproteobacteria bacterium]
MKTIEYIVVASFMLSVSAVAAGCATEAESNRPDNLAGAEPGSAEAVATAPGSEEGGAAAGVEGTFDHPAAIGGAAVSAREALDRMLEEGPPAFSARVHSCRKMSYANLGRLLGGLGVDLDAVGEVDAGRMYGSSDQALGAPNYGARIAESTEVTVAVASRTFDIFVQAAPEIIANLPDVERCQVGGVGARVFDEAGRCNRDGLSCLLGESASAAHVAVCDNAVGEAATAEEGQAIAVAALLSAAHACE